MPKTLALLCLAALAPGCELFCDGSKDYYPAIVLTVVDSAGEPVDGASGSYTVGGDDSTCDAYEGGTLECGGPDDGGLYTIEVEAPGFVSQVIEVDVATEECRAVAEELTVTLQEA